MSLFALSGLPDDRRLGIDPQKVDSSNSPNPDNNVLRHYSFEKALLGRFISLDSLSKSSDAATLLDYLSGANLSALWQGPCFCFVLAFGLVHPGGSCYGKSRALDSRSSSRGWRQSEPNGFAMTDEARAFVRCANSGVRMAASLSSKEKKMGGGFRGQRSRTGQPLRTSVLRLCFRLSQSSRHAKKRCWAEARSYMKFYFGTT